jgi:rod shape-determining protein MreD
VRVVIYGAIALITLIAQMGVIPHLLIDGQGPVLAVVPVVAVGLLYGPGEGAWAGAVIGALTDVLIGGPWGLATLMYMAVGFVAGRFAGAGRAALGALAFFGCGAAAAIVRAAGIVGLRAAGAHVSLAALVPGLVTLGYTAVLGPPLVAILDGRVGRGRRERARVQA